MDLKSIALSLGLAETATEADITNKLNALQAAQVEGILALGRQKGVVNEGNVAAWRTQVTQNPEFARLSWEGLADANPQHQRGDGTQTLAAALKNEGTRTAKVGTLSDERKTWTIDDWRKNDAEGFLALETESPADYSRLVGSLVRNGLAMAHYESDKK